MTTDFYARLPAVDDFAAITDPQRYTAVPPDWHIVITDVEGSTQAVEAGRYRAVNFVGAASIAALINAAGDVDIPFVFGGDGATLLVPGTLVPAIEATLRSLQTKSLSEFGLRLRAGLIPVADVYATQHAVQIAKYQASADYAQAVFLGGGLAWAEQQLKDPERGTRYRLAAYGSHPEPDFSGVECRWNQVRSPHGETVTLLVAASADGVTDAEVYEDVLATIDRIYGADADRRPVVPDQLKAAFSFRNLSALEPHVRVPASWWRRAAYTLRIWFQQVLLIFFLRFNITTGTTRWRDYPGQISATTDHKKFDEVLRMVLAGTSKQRHALMAELEMRYQQGELAYGLHVSDSTVMTCLVYERMGQQVHFVDGAGGGYTRAAKDLKLRLQMLATSERQAA
ncbi:MAG: DUF3095 domain-containing protein [Rhodothermales bacterium]